MWKLALHSKRPTRPNVTYGHAYDFAKRAKNTTIRISMLLTYITKNDWNSDFNVHKVPDSV